MDTLPIGTEIDDLGELIMGGFADERDPESRGNPNHDKKGQFAKGASYAPGKWDKRSGTDAMVAEIEGKFKANVSPEQAKLNTAKDGPDWAHKKAVFLASGLNADSTITYHNGPHSIQFTGKADEKSQQQFLKDFDHMQTKYPAGKEMSITVDPTNTFGKGVGAETTAGTGYMRVNESTLTEATWPGMPVSSKVTSSQYVLAHEWGHVITSNKEQKNKEVHQVAIKAGGLTRYGTVGATGVLAPGEGFAESFAEWSMTDGKTTNPAAKVYADKFKWGDQFGTD